MRFSNLYKIFLVLDIVFVLLHILNGSSNQYLNLDQENNFPVYYQAAKYVALCSVLALTIYIISNAQKLRTIKKLLIANYIVFGYLVIDELGQFHENIKNILESFGLDTAKILSIFENWGYNSTEWLIFYIPVFIMVFLLMASTIWYFYRYFTARIYSLYAAGIGCFILVPIVEYFNIKQPRESFEYYWLMVLEESLELIGVTLFFASIYFLFRRLQSDDSVVRSPIVGQEK